MKKVLSTIRVCVLIVGSLLTLASCGNTISGTYEGEVNLIIAKYTVTYAFNGNSVEITSTVSGAGGSYTSDPVTATYEIKEDENGKKTITFDYGEAEAEEGMEEDGVAVSFVEGEEEGVKYIKIAGIRYNKVEN